MTCPDVWWCIFRGVLVCLCSLLITFWVLVAVVFLVFTWDQKRERSRRVKPPRD